MFDKKICTFSLFTEKFTDNTYELEGTVPISTSLKSKYIESIILGFPHENIVFLVNNSKWIVLEGTTILTILKEFVLENSFELEGLEILTYLNGKSFKDFNLPEVRSLVEKDTHCTLIRIGNNFESKVYYYYKNFLTDRLKC